MSANTAMLEIKPEKWAYWTVILIGFVSVLILGKSFIIPIVLAVFITVLLSALQTQLMKVRLFGLRFNKLSSTLLAITLLAVVNYIVTAVLTEQLSNFRDYIPIYQKNFENMLNALFEIPLVNALPNVEAVIGKFDFAGILVWMSDSLTLVLSNVFLTLLYSAFLFVEKDRIPQKLSHLKSDMEKSQYILEVCQKISWSIQKYIGMKAVMSGLTAIVSYIILLLLDVHFPSLCALLIFFLNFIPNIGSILGVILPSVLALFQFDSISPFLMVSVSLGVIQFVIGNIIEPSYMGKNLNLSSFVVLISLSFWGVVWGLVGMFLSVPLLVMTSLVCRHIKGLQWISIMLSSDGKLTN